MRMNLDPQEVSHSPEDGGVLHDTMAEVERGVYHMESELNHMESEFRGFQEDCKSGWFQDMQTFHKNVKMFLEQVKTLAIQPLAPFPCEEHVRSMCGKFPHIDHPLVFYAV